eukprot:gene8929-6265_t
MFISFVYCSSSLTLSLKDNSNSGLDYNRLLRKGFGNLKLFVSLKARCGCCLLNHHSQISLHMSLLHISHQLINGDKTNTIDKKEKSSSIKAQSSIFGEWCRYYTCWVLYCIAPYVNTRGRYYYHLDLGDQKLIHFARAGGQHLSSYQMFDYTMSCSSFYILHSFYLYSFGTFIYSFILKFFIFDILFITPYITPIYIFFLEFLLFHITVIKKRIINFYTIFIIIIIIICTHYVLIYLFITIIIKLIEALFMFVVFFRKNIKIGNIDIESTKWILKTTGCEVRSTPYSPRVLCGTAHQMNRPSKEIKSTILTVLCIIFFCS